VRLLRTRRGKTPIDITVVKQGDGPSRVRITVGDDWSNPSAKKNSDLDVTEVDNLITMLEYYKRVATGEIKIDD